MTQPEVDRDNLINDSVTVLEARKDCSEERLLRFTATPAMVLDWYYSTDPLREADNKVSMGLYGETELSPVELAKRYLEVEFRTPMLNEAAGLTLVAAVVEPEIGVNTGYSWVKRFAHIPDGDHTARMQKNGQLFLGELLKNLPKYLSADDFNKLYIALDCLSNAGNRFGYLAQSEELRKHHPMLTTNDLISKSTTYQRLTFELARILVSHKDRAQDPESYKTAYQAGLFWGASMLTHTNMVFENRQRPENLDESEVNSYYGFSALEHSIRSYFVDNPFKPDRKVIKGEDKGLLHEALWLMDINFLMRQPASGLKAPGYAIQTFPRTDRPEINYPTYKRAYDVHIALSSNGRTIPVQLKSSENAAEMGSAYHPNVMVVTEDNLQEVDVRRLGAKLAAYKTWLDSGCKPDKLAAVYKYILPSAAAFIDTVREIEDMSIEDYKMQKLPVAGLDRAAKRRLRRSIRKFGE